MIPRLIPLLASLILAREQAPVFSPNPRRPPAPETDPLPQETAMPPPPQIAVHLRVRAVVALPSALRSVGQSPGIVSLIPRR